MAPRRGAKRRQVHPPVALSLYATNRNTTDYGLLMAGSVLVIVPILVLFLFLQKYFTAGIATTGIK